MVAPSGSIFIRFTWVAIACLSFLVFRYRMLKSTLSNTTWVSPSTYGWEWWANNTVKTNKISPTSYGTHVSVRVSVDCNRWFLNLIQFIFTSWWVLVYKKYFSYRRQVCWMKQWGQLDQWKMQNEVFHWLDSPDWFIIIEWRIECPRS